MVFNELDLNKYILGKGFTNFHESMKFPIANYLTQWIDGDPYREILLITLSKMLKILIALSLFFPM